MKTQPKNTILNTTVGKTSEMKMLKNTNIQYLLIFGLLLTAFGMAGCKKYDAAADYQNRPPEIGIIYKSHNSAHVNEHVTIRVATYDPDGQVASVWFYKDNILYSVAINEPWEVVFRFEKSVTFSIFAVDNQGYISDVVKTDVDRQ